MRLAGRNIDGVLLGILFVALICRVYLAQTTPYIHDEINNSIALAKTISLSPGSLNLPLRGENHGALPAYVVKASGALFGQTPVGYRSLHVLLGLVATALIYLVSRIWFGLAAARWAAACIAFNDYFLPISARATAHAPFLCLVAASMLAFSRFLMTQRPAYLYAAGALAGLAFYCKEHAALLLPAFFVALLYPSLRHWLRRPQAYVAAAVFALMLAPDLYWNVVTPRSASVTYGDQEALQAHYSNHLSRVGGVGFSFYPLMFYGRAAVQPVYRAVTGQTLYDDTAEYSSINPVLGAILLGSVVAALFLLRPYSSGTVFLLAMFWVVFGLFTLIQRGDPPGRLSPVSWIWVESSMLPAAALTGGILTRRARPMLILQVLTAIALAYAVVRSLTG